MSLMYLKSSGWIEISNSEIESIPCPWVGTDKLVYYDSSKLHISLSLESADFHDDICLILADALAKKIINGFKYSSEDHPIKKNIEYVIYLPNSYDEKIAPKVFLVCQKLLAILKKARPADTSHCGPYLPIIPPYFFYRQTARDKIIEYIDYKHPLAAEVRKQAETSEWYLYLCRSLVTTPSIAKEEEKSSDRETTPTEEKLAVSSITSNLVTHDISTSAPVEPIHSATLFSLVRPSTAPQPELTATSTTTDTLRGS